MGLFDSNSKRSTTTNNVNLDSSDKRLVEGNSGYVGGNINLTSGGNLENVTLETTDFGAVRGALDLGETVVDGLGVFASQALEQNGNIVKQQSFSNSQNLQALKDFASEVQTGGQLELSKAMKVVAVSVVVVMGLVVVVVSRGKK